MSNTPFVAEATFHVRYAETDAQGIVHHASYIVYFEEGRSEYIRQRGSSYADFERSGFYLAVTREGTIGAGDDLNTKDRVATECEEVVVYTDFFDLQHVGPDLSQDLLRFVARSDKIFRQLGPVLFRRRQCAPVNLAARGSWQLVEKDKRRRHHV